MFRVPLDTVLLRASATGLVALTTLLSACGSDPKPAAQVPASTSPAADSAAALTSPQIAQDPQTAAALKEAAKKAKAVEDDTSLSAKEKTKKEMEIAKEAVAGNVEKVTDTPESAQTIKDASAKKETKSSLKDAVQTAKDALDKAGQKATKVQMSGAVGAAIQVENTTIVFYSSAKKAAKNAETFATAIAANPDFGRISRTDNRIYLLSVAKKVTPEDTSSYDAVRKVVDGAL